MPEENEIKTVFVDEPLGEETETTKPLKKVSCPVCLQEFEVDPETKEFYCYVCGTKLI